MEITFLGGAEEIGASCAVLDLEGVRVLVDCGQRLGAPSGQALPDFSLLEDGPPIDAVFITHAHADHIGGLPALEPILSADCPIYATEPTIALTKVMLQDSVRIMARFRGGDGDLPMFPPSNVSPALQRFQQVRWGKPFRIVPNREVVAVYHPSGHIVGAGMIEFRGKSGSVLFSGDVSVADQLSVAGVFAPAIQPSILVLESTYGGRLHAHRPTQERRLVERVRETIAAGGSVLFPTFALGQAQEILLLLGRAMRDRSLDRVPVFADGLVRAVSKVYNRMHDDLSPWCRRLWENGLDPIFPEDLPVRSVKDERQRSTIAGGPPCVVVASSGMLQGGASHFYAKEWINDPKCLIMITGYQDEESPGQALLNLATRPAGEPRRFKLAGIMTDVHCQVESCWLSAHADNGELVALASKLAPKMILPVHGDGDARKGLARSLSASTKARVVLPLNGEKYSLNSAELNDSGRPRGRVSPLNFWPPWDPNSPRELDLQMFHSWLSSLELPPAWITLDELAELWKSPGSASGAEWEALRQAVYQESQPYFVPDAKRPYLLHLTPLENLSAQPMVERLSTERATAAIREAFPVETGLTRFGFYPEERVVQLHFRFPAAARTSNQARLRVLETRIGWKVELNEEARREDLLEVARHIVDRPDVDVVVLPEQATVRLFSPTPFALEQEDVDQYQRRTGYRLELAGAANLA